MIDPRRSRRGVPAGALDRLLLVVVGRLGVPFRGVWVLEVAGRRTRVRRRVPVIPVTVDGRRHLVAPRGETGWVRNLEAAGTCRLVRGTRRTPWTAERLGPGEAAPVIGAYHAANRRLTGRFFALPDRPSPDDVARVADRHPVFLLRPA